MSERPITVTGTQVVEWGQDQAAFLMGIMKEAAEEHFGYAMEWRQEVNRDAQTLVRLAPKKPDPPAPYARIDLYDEHTVVQYLPETGDRLLRHLLLVVDYLKNQTPLPFVQACEVERVKE